MKAKSSGLLKSSTKLTVSALLMCKYLDDFANVVSPQDKKSSPNVTLKSFDVILHSVASVRNFKVIKKLLLEI